MLLPQVHLKSRPDVDERWVQDVIKSQPSILGLGDLEVFDVERRQPAGGRLDLLLRDPDTLKRYEVELQLGATDETHIIRTIEYWDVERRRYPQYEHSAVLVAEEVTTRFLNVIQLFNGAIPLIVLKMTAYQVGDQVALTFVKVLDEFAYGFVDADEPVSEPTDRPYWEAKATKPMLALTDRLFEVVKRIEPTADLRYNKYYIGVGVDRRAFNFVTFVPRKRWVAVTLKLPKADEVEERLEQVGLDAGAYDRRWGQYQVKVGADVDADQLVVLEALMAEAREHFAKGD